jgi:cell division protein FtsB
MDNNTFALFVLGFGTVLIALLIWQLLSIARARMQLDRTAVSAEQLERSHEGVQQLDARLSALADDVQAIERRVAQLETTPRS